MTLLAYQGREDCVSMECRRYLDPPGEPISPGCIGWHCPVCGEPSSQYGHPECQPPETPASSETDPLPSE